MLRVAFLASWLTIVLAAYGAAAQKPFIDCNREELVRAVPELADLQFDESQDGLDGLLRATGENLGSMFAKLMDISAAEDIHEMHFEDGMVGISRRETWRYLVTLLPNGRQEQFREFRIDANTKALVQPPAQIDFLVVGNFLRLLKYLLPQYQGQLRFRYVGRKSGQGAFVVAFAQRPEGTVLRSHIQTGLDGQTAPLQGLAWIDAATKRIDRLRLDLLGPIEGFPLETVTTDISLVQVDFKSIGIELWLPEKVTVHARYAGGELHSVHRYSDYQSEPERSAGTQAVASSSVEDAYELVARGITLVNEGKCGDAITPLREALRVNPAMAIARFQLAKALRTTGDMAGAEAELREASKAVPDSVEVHNFLGILLSERGDVAGAVAEFRKGAQIQPKQPIVHFNLARALEKSGDKAAALAEYRIAFQLAPGNTTFKTRYEQFERAANLPPVPASETTIRVDVRQVLVPVIVTDKEGHYVTGLKQADFQIFEDGVEQKISALSVAEDGLAVSSTATTGISSATQPAAGQGATGGPAASKPAQIRRTFVVCIDSLHTAFGSLVHVRQALAKLFKRERPADSQYVVVAIGTSTQLVEDTTTDPEKVLQAIESKDFQKLFLSSRKSSTEAELLAFRRTLDEARAACDTGQSECIRKNQLPSQAGQIAAADRVDTMSFLSQFHSLVKDLARASDRRTLVLISDGFQLVPGKQAFELLVAYFPELRSISLRTVDRMTDLDPVLRLAANNNIPIYTIDSRGLYTSPYFDASNPGGAPRLGPAVESIMSSDASEAGGTLSEIAAATGGTAFQNSNDILTGLERAFADGRQYYMLAYVPGNSNADGKFHAISVRVRDQHMVVKAKRGYWAVGG
jgi:VWFA-related protein